MGNPFSKGWKYLTSALDSKIEENADPEVQINQAVDQAKQQHADLTKQAATVIGNKRQLEMKANRLLESQRRLEEQARTAVRVAEEAQAKGDAAKAQELTNAAEIYASQLVTVEQQIEENKELQVRAEQAAAQAQQQVTQSEGRLQEQLSDAKQLRSQAAQAKMQETTAQTMQGMSAGTASPNDTVPTLDAVREKIERRYAEALGAQELTQNSVTGRMQEIQSAGTDMKAAARLEKLRAELGTGSSGEHPKAVERGSAEAGRELAAGDAAQAEGEN